MTKAPIHTDGHFILASGKILNISANNEVIIAREKIVLSTLKSTRKDSDQYCWTQEPIADKKEDSTSEISNKKAIDIIKPKEKSLVFINIQRSDLVSETFTCQILFRIFWSSTNTAVAPIIIVEIPIIVAITESLLLRDMIIIFWIWSAMSPPITEASCWCRWPLTASSPKKYPPNVITTTSKPGMANIAL